MDPNATGGNNPSLQPGLPNLVQSNGDKSESESPGPFADLMALEKLDDPDSDQLSSGNEKVEKFRSRAVPCGAVGGIRAFGGHVYAQSAYAASKTVKDGFVVHNMSGSFVLQGRTDRPFIFSVRHIRDGANYCVRAVDVRQKDRICFTCLCSFKLSEKHSSPSFHHQPVPVQARYKSVLDGKRPQDHPNSPAIDVDWYIEEVESGDTPEEEFPGLHARKPDMRAYNETEEVKRSPEKYRQLGLYCLRGSPEAEGEQRSPTSQNRDELRAREQTGEFDNLYACAHMYACDKNSLFLAARALGHQTFSAMASLSITVVFHQHGESLRMVDWDAVPEEAGESLPKKWFIQEAWSPSSGDSRVAHESRLWGPDGTLLATTLQDGQLRLHDTSAKL